MGAVMDGFDQYERALSVLASRGAESLSGDVVEAAAENWIETSHRVMGHDTYELENSTRITFLDDTTAVLDASAEHASHHNNGTRNQAANGFWEAGELAAADLIAKFGGRYESVVAEGLDSGGIPKFRYGGSS